MSKRAFLFPGQGAQYVGMCKDFVDAYPVAKQTFEEADDLLGRKLSSVVFEGPEALLTETKNSQLGIYVASVAILRTIQSLYPEFVASMCAGLSLGEYTALTASGRLSFIDGISLVRRRGEFMNEACESTEGTMAVILGLSAAEVEQLVIDVNMPNDLWAANFNCPGQTVISGTLKGIEAGSIAAKAKGAKRVLPLQVHGAFHSGLMEDAKEKLSSYIEDVTLNESACEIVMNVTGSSAEQNMEIRRLLVEQVTHPVRWEQSMRFMIAKGVTSFIEIGCGKALTGFTKRIDPLVSCVSIEKIEDLKSIEGLK